MNVEEKLAQAQQLKELGNDAFKQGDSKQALRKYHEALLTVHGLSAPNGTLVPGRREQFASDEQQPLIDALLTSIHGNMAACHIKSEQWERAIDCCVKALKSDTENFKARIRLVNAYLSTGALVKAEQELNRLTEPQQDMPDVKQLRYRLRKLDDASLARQRSEFAGMFGR